MILKIQIQWPKRDAFPKPYGYLADQMGEFA